jgi:hypothetical protein
MGQAGLMIERSGEPPVGTEVAKIEPTLEETVVAPIFLHVPARKPAL